jgi:glucose/arabinose dehydrogenase
LRNPWRFSFASNGDIWVGDVGQNAFEEITVITAPGQNFGWKIMEACHCFGTTTCDNSGMIQPVWEYDHSLGSR